MICHTAIVEDIMHNVNDTLNYEKLCFNSYVYGYAMLFYLYFSNYKSRTGYPTQ